VEARKRGGEGQRDSADSFAVGRRQKEKERERRREHTTGSGKRRKFVLLLSSHRDNSFSIDHDSG
jgi:hypothetical protein